MSRPVLSSATRRLSLVASSPRAFSTSRSTLNRFSACSDTSLAGCRRFLTRTPRHSLGGAQLCRGNASPLITVRQRAGFSSSSVRPAAIVVQNEKKDEEGNVLMVDISARAAERLREITDPTTSPSPTKEENPYHHLRITVTSGGCHGFQYMMSLEAASKVDAEEDTIFEAGPETKPEGGEAPAGQALVVMDEPSLELLSGSTVDYTMELIGSQFKIVDNPRASSNCGCGTSFDVE